MALFSDPTVYILTILLVDDTELLSVLKNNVAFRYVVAQGDHKNTNNNISS